MRWVILLLAVTPAWCWWQVGHKAVAGVAYDQLTKTARGRVDAMLKNHPDYGKFIAGAPAGEKARARFAFMQASYWADVIKQDPRFYDDLKRGATPTPLLPGFTDMRQHTNWHYINVAFSTDGTTVPPPPEPNALTQIKMMLASFNEDQVIYLPWLLHLVGDVHQPMHCVARYRRSQVDARTGNPVGDLGGNSVFLSNSMNLHAFWDSRLGDQDSPAIVEAMVKVLGKHAREAKTITDPDEWVREGFEVAKSVVYTFGNEGGTKDNPVRIPDAYVVKAKQIAIERGGLAGHRLAAVLNEKLK